MNHDETQRPSRGRYAPSPTGDIHLGNARTALVAWLSIRSQRGSLVWRVEDLDQGRSVPEIAARQRHDLSWLGLDWDEGPDLGGPFPPYAQSARSEFYQRALIDLRDNGHLFPCPRSRTDLASLASAPHGCTETPYPARLRPSQPSNDLWLERLLAEDLPPASVRFRVEPEQVTFDDLIQGRVVEDVSRTVGDFVLRRRDGQWAYQLAVVVDDAQQEISEVVRGSDLLGSTARQMLLQRALGLPTPRYAHVPVIVAPNGDKLSKRHGDTSLSMLEEAGCPPERIVGFLGWSLRLLSSPRPTTAASLIENFAFDRLPTEDTKLTAEHLEFLAGRRQRLD